jgi:H+/Cl- antiporter ClcA
MIAGLSTRSRRRLQITSARWQRRAIFLLGGILVGAAAVVLAVLADQAQIAFTSISGMPGGIFSPALAVGAGLGANIASLFQGAPLPAISQSC